MRALEDAGDLLADAFERAPDRGLGRAGGLQLGDELAGLADVGVDGEPVVAAQDDREVGVGGHGNRIVRQRGQRRGDLLKQSVLCGG